MRILSLICMALMLVGCARNRVEEPLPVITELAKTSKTQTYKVADFNQLVVKGQINVSLHTGYAKPEVILRGDPRDLIQVVIKEKNNRLLIYIGKGHPRFGAVYADIRGRQLSSFTYKGSGIVTGTRLYSSSLNLYIDNPGKTTLGGNLRLHNLDVKGSGVLVVNGVNASGLVLSMTGSPKVQFTGVAHLTNLNLKGDGSFSMYWIKSDTLKIRAKDNIFLQLAGVANRLDVELWDNSRFKGRYLRADRAFVKTHDHAIAELSAIKRQHTLATDASDIYFYNIPTMKTDFMAYSGAVLDMRDWSVYAMQEYDRYNKQMQ